MSFKLAFQRSRRAVYLGMSLAGSQQLRARVTRLPSYRRCISLAGAVPQRSPLASACFRPTGRLRIAIRSVATAADSRARSSSGETKTTEVDQQKQKEQKTKSKATRQSKAEKKKKPAATKPPKKPKKKAKLTEKQKQQQKVKAHREMIKDLKIKALQPPAMLPLSWNSVAVQRKFASTPPSPEDKELKLPQRFAKYCRDFTPEEIKIAQEIASSNRAINEASYREWLNSHTPLQIMEANAARHKLRRLTGKRSPYNLHDDRQLKKPPSAFVLFVKDKFQTRDPEQRPVSAVCQAAKEWASLPVEEKQKYVEQNLALKKRYEEEYRSVYGKEKEWTVQFQKKKPVAKEEEPADY